MAVITNAQRLPVRTIRLIENYLFRGERRLIFVNIKIHCGKFVPVATA